MIKGWIVSVPLEVVFEPIGHHIHEWNTVEVLLYGMMMVVQRTMTQASKQGNRQTSQPTQTIKTILIKATSHINVIH
jgi:hypothetical protein